MPTIRDVAAVLEAWAPRGSAQSYDNVGLQVGDAGRRVSRGLIALDLTPEVIEEATQRGADLIITHHPIIFKPLTRVVETDSFEALPFRLIRANIAHYAIHTNVDAAPGGVSFALAEKLGLSNIRFLDRFAGVLRKVVVFVPHDHADRLRRAMADAGAGWIGEYEACAFGSEGTGYFQPGKNANPYLGEAGGGTERVNEVRLEMEVPEWSLRDVISAMIEAHPYEEVAYDVYVVGQQHSRSGFGAVGELELPVSLREFLENLCVALDCRAPRFVGDLDGMIERVAVCGGSGSSLINAARRTGADAYVTADITYHKFFDVLDGRGEPRMALIDAGHYETERMTEELLLDVLRKGLPEIDWERTAFRTSPIDTYIAGDSSR